MIRVGGVLRPVCLLHMFDLIKYGYLAEAALLLDDFWADDVTAFVQEYGFELLGCGAYSTVFSIPGTPTVIKMNHASGDSWPVYAEYSMGLGDINPMLPRIYEIHKNLDNNMVIAVVERLEPARITKSIGMWNVIKAIHRDMQRGKVTKRGLRNSALSYMRIMFDIDAKGHYSPINLAKIVIWLTGKIMEDYSTIDADFHSGNWMMRGKQLVLNDPIC